MQWLKWMRAADQWDNGTFRRVLSARLTCVQSVLAQDPRVSGYKPPPVVYFNTHGSMHRVMRSAYLDYVAGQRVEDRILVAL